MLPAIRPAILLVDDDSALLSVLARRMTREGYDVRTAPSGYAALSVLEKGWPALIVADLMMPGMDGFELCRRIKRMADLPIIVLSAVDASESKVRALEDYAEDYITKPFDPDELVARVQRVLRRTSSGRSTITIDDELEIDLASKRRLHLGRQRHADAGRDQVPADPDRRRSTAPFRPRHCWTEYGPTRTEPIPRMSGSPSAASGGS